MLIMLQLTTIMVAISLAINRIHMVVVSSREAMAKVEASCRDHRAEVKELERYATGDNQIPMLIVPASLRQGYRQSDHDSSGEYSNADSYRWRVLPRQQ